MSRLSANDTGDNEMTPEAVHRSPGIYLTGEETPGKPQLVDRLVKEHFFGILGAIGCCPWSYGLRSKKPSPPALAPSVASVTSVANDKGDNVGCVNGENE